MPLVDSIQRVRRCAVYTRKSVQQDPTQQFGSLEAQRSICCSYIASQKPRGWVEVARHYDDDGQSGGDLRRPALQELLSDIESGLVDVVVIYKLDRITRTLLDFVRLMDLMDQFGVGFVAVTQNFDTSDSTGRLKPPGLYYESGSTNPKVRVWARTWAEIIQDAKVRLQFYKEKLSLEVDSEVAAVLGRREGE